MIVVNRDIQINKIAISLREKQTEETGYFLFVFTCDLTQKKIIVTLEDKSGIKSRANMFCIPGDLFTSTGWYHFKVFENPDQHTTTEDLTCIDHGRCKVIQDETPTKAYKIEIINKVYDDSTE